LANDQKVVVLYFGDHDPSGLDMIRDIRDRLLFMFKNGNWSDRLENIDDFEYPMFEVKQIGLTMSQIKKYNLPPNPTKLTDSRANGYIQKFGKTCWEVDALKPQTLSDIVEKNIEDIIDMEQYNSMLEEEKLNINELKQIINER